MDDEEKLAADQLPPGTTPPLWIDVPGGYSQRDILEKISQLPEMRGLSTTVIYGLDYEERDEGANEFCRGKGWNYGNLALISGSEDQCVIVLNALEPETVSRPHRLLVVVTTAGHK